MKKQLSTEFSTRQIMHSNNYEIFYYCDSELSRVSMHTHEHYELYFFLEGDLDYEIAGKNYDLKPGDFMLIPPGLIHQPQIHSMNIPYRRMILWISREYFEGLCQSSKDYSYGFQYVKEKKSYHFRPDFITSREIQGRLLELLEEMNAVRPFRELYCDLKVAFLLTMMNRAVYELVNKVTPSYENALYLSICDYINNHLQEELSLENIAAFFFVSKYHIAHVFKENMGISVHQYILKKRLQAARTGIVSGIPIGQVGQELGFADYTSFFRAFKKEYEISPKEYREQYMLTDKSVNGARLPQE